MRRESGYIISFFSDPPLQSPHPTLVCKCCCCWDSRAFLPGPLMELSTIDTVARYCAVKAGLLCVYATRFKYRSPSTTNNIYFFSSSTPPIPRLCGGKEETNVTRHTHFYLDRPAQAVRAELGYIDANSSSSSLEPPIVYFSWLYKIITTRKSVCVLPNGAKRSQWKVQTLVGGNHRQRPFYPDNVKKKEEKLKRENNSERRQQMTSERRICCFSFFVKGFHGYAHIIITVKTWVVAALRIPAARFPAARLNSRKQPKILSFYIFTRREKMTTFVRRVLLFNMSSSSFLSKESTQFTCC